MIKHTDEFLQFAEPVTCREHILPRDDESADPKGWIQGNTKIGPVLEVTTSYLQGKYGVEIRIDSVNKDSSHRIRNHFLGRRIELDGIPALDLWDLIVAVLHGNTNQSN